MASAPCSSQRKSFFRSRSGMPANLQIEELKEMKFSMAACESKIVGNHPGIWRGLPLFHAVKHPSPISDNERITPQTGWRPKDVFEYASQERKIISFLRGWPFHNGCAVRREEIQNILFIGGGCLHR